MRIYVASSWRNEHQPGVVEALRRHRHLVYDFRNPPNRSGFGWSQIDPNWQSWTAEEYTAALDHAAARAGFASDMGALDACELCLLVWPSGRSAHLEAGWASGAGKACAVYYPPNAPRQEPELMVKMLGGPVLTSLPGVVQWAGSFKHKPNKGRDRLFLGETT